MTTLTAIASSSVARADATCAVELRGDAAITEPLRAELRSFDEDGVPCVAVQVTCRRDGDELEIELRDELGRSSIRVFTNPVGAAAFVVSWSRRPVMDELEIHPPSAAVVLPPTRTAPPGPTPLFGPPPAQGFHAELAATYIGASGPDQDWWTASAALMWQSWRLRYGGNVRAITAGDRYFRVEAEAIIGMVTMLPYAFELRGELVGGLPLALLTASVNEFDYGATGRRVGAALTISRRLTGSVSAELGIGYDLSWQTHDVQVGDTICGPFVTACDEVTGFAHAAAGLRWTL